MKMRIVFVLAVVVAMCRPVAAQTVATSQPVTQSARQRGPEVVKLTVHPAPPPVPALKWRLIPGAAERKPGNAAQLYLMAMMAVPDDSKTWDAVMAVADAPIGQAPPEAIKEFDRVAQLIIPRAQLGAWREYCQWDLPWEQGVAMFMPHLNYARAIANVLAARARLQIADGDLPGAVHTLEILFSLARDLNDNAVIVQALVGTGIASVGATQVQELIQRPGAPNLYWAVASLPRPYVDVAAAVDRERRWVFETFPVLRAVAEGQPVSPDQWRELSAQMEQVRGSIGLRQDAPAYSMIGPTGLFGAVSAYAQAKSFFLARGMTTQQFEAMNVPTALARWMIESYTETFDELAKWSLLAPEQREADWTEAEQRFSQSQRGSLNPLMAFVASVRRPGLGFARLDRRLAMLQAVEAIRAYAAGHDGALPAKLADVTETPVPEDPMLGRAFEYRVEGNTFVLGAPPPSTSPADASFGVRFEVTLASNEPRP